MTTTKIASQYAATSMYAELMQRVLMDAYHLGNLQPSMKDIIPWFPWMVMQNFKYYHSKPLRLGFYVAYVFTLKQCRFICSYTKDWKFKLQVFLSYNKLLLLFCIWRSIGHMSPSPYSLYSFYQK
ncbi:uncharacterized protein LOC133735269 isoform X3 [Rosa rugosa]|nr:uncharacterized protein LOC133735269 isoform X3 [Rosa rugosa]XP_062018659.1 uncharacterized protein LOC133735269 isoform X3 [Rosa rugosa]XP_062018660.1 uncharacterized protein LOC133735269 isoform X3 [Rosa rugosa]XP_062018661.1 uncharacterized protein LOC133735269 isoform X3 [Rosa rugosa]